MPDRPTIAELRAVTQPPSVTGRRNSEHWTGDLYQRRLSPYLTRVLLGTAITANGVTVLMIVTGAAAGAALLVPGLLGRGARRRCSASCRCCGTAATARWRAGGRPSRRPASSSTSWATPSRRPAIPLALGVRADGGFDSIGGWTTLGAVLVGARAGEQVAQRRRAPGQVGERPAAAGGPGRGGRAPGGGRAPAAVAGQVRAVPPGLPLGRADPAGAGRRASSTRCPAAGWTPPGCWWWRWWRPRPSPWWVTWRRSSPRAGCGEPARPSGPWCSAWATGRSSSPRALESLLAQEGVELDVVLVGNGWEPVGLPDGRPHRAPAGERRHPGGPQRRGRRVARRRAVLLRRRRLPAHRRTWWRGWSPSWRADSRVGAVQPRPVDPTGKPSPKRWVPRPGGRDPLRPGLVGWLWEGTFVIRRHAVRAGRRLARALLVRPRGHRALLAGLGRRLASPGTPPTS